MPMGRELQKCNLWQLYHILLTATVQQQGMNLEGLRHVTGSRIVTSLTPECCANPSLCSSAACSGLGRSPQPRQPQKPQSSPATLPLTLIHTPIRT